MGFWGSYHVDFVCYVARILSCMGKEVLVIDASPTQEFSHFFTNKEAELSVISQCNVDFTTKGTKLLPKDSAYDVMLFYFGDHFDAEQLRSCTEIFALSFWDRIAMERLRLQTMDLRLPIDVILRNYCGAKHDRKQCMSLLKNENIFIAQEYYIAFDEMDENYRIRMQYEAIGDFRHISSGMEKVLIRIVNVICPSEWQTIKNAVRKAKRGAWL